jgi:hypothetical protein
MSVKTSKFYVCQLERHTPLVSCASMAASSDLNQETDTASAENMLALLSMPATLIATVQLTISTNMDKVNLAEKCFLAGLRIVHTIPDRFQYRGERSYLKGEEISRYSFPLEPTVP